MPTRETKRLCVLLLEDNPADAELVLRELQRAGIGADVIRVATRADFEARLDPCPDAILSDFNLPGWTGLAALQVVRGRGLDVPFILVSGSIGEDIAVEAMRLGADDYLLKDRLSRLGGALTQALERKRLRDKGTRAIEEQREARQLLTNIVENIPTAVQLKSVQDEFRIVMWNKAAEAMYGLPRSDVIGRNVHDLWPKADADRMHAADLDLIASGGIQDFPDRLAQTKHGDIRVHMRKVALSDADGRATHLLVIADDITARLSEQARLRESEAGLRRAQVMAKLASVVTGPDGAFESWSETLPELLGMQPEQIPRATRDWLELVHPDDRPVVRSKVVEAAAEGTRTKIKYRLRRADGAWISVRHTMDPLRGERDVLRWFTTLQDVTEQREAEEKIERLNRVYAVLSGINALIVRASSREELFRETCRLAVEAGKFKLAWIGMVDRKEMRLTPVAWHGAGEDYIQLMPLRVGNPAPEGSGLSASAINERKAMVSDDMTRDPRVRLKAEALERGFHALAMLPLVVGEEAVGILALYAGEVGFFDADEMRLLNELAGDISFALEHIGKAEKLDYLAYYDALTGLANRTLFHERLEQAIAAAGRSKRKVALVIQDIERFRTVNDSLGRQAGDLLLKQYAERLRQVARDDSWLGRLGADQFAVLVPDVTSEEELARRTGQRVQEMLSAPYRVGEVDLTISARLGLAVYPADGADADALLRNAEAALKKAKATGERFLFYAQEMSERVADKLSLDSKLRRALENDEFLLHYQPKVDADTRRILGVEALIRWHNPERGLVPPAQFIPLLEETGLIQEVGSWALKRAARDHRRWVEQKLKAPRVAVNVSQIQLRQRDFVGVVEQAVMEGSAPVGIDLEITESMAMQDVQANIEKLAALRKLGIRIAIDDFGTGYSSLGYLAKLPVESLKIDRSFISLMHTDPNAMTLVTTIISLAHSLRLKVVAEGVETEDQARFLRLLRCDEMQGYLFSKPLPEAELVKLLRG